MIKNWPRLALLASLICCITGCASLPHTNPLPQGLELRKVSSIDAGAPFSYSESAGLLAVADGKLRVVDLKKDSTRTVAAERPAALAFSAADGRLVAAFFKENGSAVRIYDASGKVLGETTVDGKVTTLSWRDNGEVLIAALGIRKFSFGSQLNSLLYRWDGKGKPAGTNLNCTTVRPHLAKLPEEILLKTFSMALSPYGDEVVVTKLKDPPMFSPFLQIATHNLETGGGQHVGEAAMGAGGPLFSPDGKKVLVGGTRNATRWLAAAGGKEEEAYPSRGETIALSPTGLYALVDGRLYLKDAEIATFPAETHGAFSGDGASLVLRYREALYLLTGLNDRPAPALEKSARLLELRRLRSSGLITQEELEKGTQTPTAPAR